MTGSPATMTPRTVRIELDGEPITEIPRAAAGSTRRRFLELPDKGLCTVCSRSRGQITHALYEVRGQYPRSMQVRGAHSLLTTSGSGLT